MNGYWGNWENYYEHSMYGGHGIRWGYRGHKDDFVVYRAEKHPGDFSFRITMISFNDSYLTKGEWREYKGYIEYRSPHAYYKTGDSEYFVRYSLPAISSAGDYTIKRPATIKINKGNTGYTYNVFFDSVGFGLTVPWQHAK